MKGSSRPRELLLPLVYGDRRRPLGRQIEDNLREQVRDGRLAPGAELPSTRDLAAQLGVTRRLVVNAYAQLTAEGYLDVRQGARTTVAYAPSGAREPETTTPVASPGRAPLHDLRPSNPDVGGFPRTVWLRSLRAALATATDADLGYGDPRGVAELRSELATYLGRVRGVATGPDRIVITSGFTQSLNLICAALGDSGAKAIAVEAPSNPEQARIIECATLTPIAVPVDERGLLVGDLAATNASAVVVTPAHQHPTGAVLHPERRTGLVAWLRERGAFAIEDDYDAEYRYDRHAVGALHGLDPEHVVYAGSTSKTLAPALRLGWLALPAALVAPVTEAKILADQGSPRIEQLALADFIRRGELDRHLRRMRAAYRRRRDALEAALRHHLPEATITGVAAGLHLTVRLPVDVDERRLQETAAERRIVLGVLADYYAAPEPRAPTMLLGYARLHEAGATSLARALRAVADESSTLRPRPSGVNPARTADSR
jgi:GntR family transcriptional regulator/MocR family aminotransferase